MSGKEDDRIVRAIEKIVSMINNLEKKVNDYQDEQKKLSDSLRGIEQNLRHLESIVAYNDHRIGSAEALNQWMIEEKDKEAVDYSLNPQEIREKMESIVSQRRARGM